MSPLLSVIHSTINDIDEYIYLFQNTMDSPFDMELIIVDSRWSQERKERIQQLSHGFKTIIYAPPKKRERNLEYDFLSAHNTGLAYADGDLCMCLGGKNELHPDFYKKLYETIQNFECLVAFRPVELEGNMGDTKWDSYVGPSNRYFIMPSIPIGRYGMRKKIPIMTCGFLIMNRSIWYLINGFDERYDVGCKWWDNDVISRLYLMRYPVVVDQQLLIYRHPHIPAQPPEKDPLCKKIYDETKPNLQVYAPNDFDLKTLHEIYKEKKKEFIV